VSVCLHESYSRAWRNNFAYRSHSAFYGFSDVAQQRRNVDQVVRNVCTLAASDTIGDSDEIDHCFRGDVDHSFRGHADQDRSEATLAFVILEK
jgi:hypothetical protein